MFSVMRDKENSREKWHRARAFSPSRAQRLLPPGLALSLDRLVVNTILGFIVAFPLTNGFQKTSS